MSSVNLPRCSFEPVLSLGMTSVVVKEMLGHIIKSISCSGKAGRGHYPDT